MVMIDDEQPNFPDDRLPRRRLDWLGPNVPGYDDDGIGQQQAGGEETEPAVPGFCPPTGDGLCLAPNGIDAMSGDYLVPPMSEEEFAALMKPAPLDENERKLLERVRRGEAARKKRRALEPGVEPRDLAQTGWGVIFPRHQAHHQRIYNALEPLLSWRRRMTGRSGQELYKEYRGVRGYGGESALAFLSRHGGNAAFVRPRRMPYYLLLVGSFEEIPAAFQYQLATRHAVGRVYFEEVAEYRRYAESVKAAEQELARRDPRWWSAKKPQKQRKMVFWSPWHEADLATRRSRGELVEPMVGACRGKRGKEGVEWVEGSQANRERLLEIFQERPGLVFTASHGLGFPPEHPLQEKLQGSLLTGDWAGPGSGAIPREHYLAAADLPGGLSLAGTILFHFACFSAGTPERSDFAFQARAGETGAARRQRRIERLGLGGNLAARPFLAALPRQLLSLPEKGGALAAVGHVDRAWTTSFSHLDEGRETIVYTSVLEMLLSGAPLGHAMQYMSMYYAQLASDVTDVEHRAGPQDVGEVTNWLMWQAMTDARNFMVIGDPAVRLLG